MVDVAEVTREELEDRLRCVEEDLSCVRRGRAGETDRDVVETLILVEVALEEEEHEIVQDMVERGWA